MRSHIHGPYYLKRPVHKPAWYIFGILTSLGLLGSTLRKPTWTTSPGLPVLTAPKNLAECEIFAFRLVLQFADASLCATYLRRTGRDP